MSTKKTSTRTVFMLSRLQDRKIIRIQVLPEKVYTDLAKRLSQIEGLLSKTAGDNNCKQGVSVSLEQTKTIPHFCLDKVSATNSLLIQMWLQEASDYTLVTK